MQRKLCRWHTWRRWVHVQCVGGRLEEWPDEFALLFGIYYNQKRRTKKRRQRKTATRRNISLSSSLAFDCPERRSDSFLSPCVCFCVCVQAHPSSTLTYSTHTYIEGNKKEIIEADYILVHQRCCLLLLYNYRIQSGATTSGQSGPESKNNEWVLLLPNLQGWNLTIRGFIDISKTLIGEGLTPLHSCRRCILQPQPTGMSNFRLSLKDLKFEKKKKEEKLLISQLNIYGNQKIWVVCKLRRYEKLEKEREARIVEIVFGLVSLFNRISTFVGYLISKPSFSKNSCWTIQSISMGIRGFMPLARILV